ncbi:MAG: hypothetical protein RR682_12615 [Cetobacterium sp.]|uniref:hypothetical protein n=1 Tax=Cetobacterium sp. TaxID=2071632 RepID=UPI002FCB7A98
MKKINAMMLLGTLFVGSIAFAESEKPFDYEKNLQERQAIDQKNIEAYSCKNGVSIQEASQKYYEQLHDEFKNNDALRNEMIKENSKD